MYVKSLILNHYRNYSHLEANFGKERIYLTGENGVGKTNILEAIYFLTLGRSFRKAEAVDLIQKGEKEASLYLTYYSEEDNKDHSVSCVLGPDYKIFALDDEKVKSVSKILGKLIAVYYEPSLVFFFRAEPEGRRKFLDETLSQLSPSYLYALARYKKLLKERNSALQQDYDPDIIKVLRNQLINLSYRIVMERKELIKTLSQKGGDYYHRLFGSDEKKFTLTYKTTCPLDDDQDSYVKNALARFEANQSVESIRKVTVIGPHRDDLVGSLRGNDLADYGSQGENRLASLSLRLASLDILTERLKKRPLLLLDDITSDLDETRTKNLLTCLNQDEQIFLTGARIREGFENYSIYLCQDNQLHKKEDNQ